MSAFAREMFALFYSLFYGNTLHFHSWEWLFSQGPVHFFFRGSIMLLRCPWSGMPVLQLVCLLDAQILTTVVQDLGERELPVR